MFSPLHIRKVKRMEGGRQMWKLLEPLTFSVTLNDVGGTVVTVPNGFPTDFASVPRWIGWIFAPEKLGYEPAIIHDFLCQLPGCSRFFADAIFREAMYQYGIPWWRRVLGYYAVRTYGALFVRKDGPT